MSAANQLPHLMTVAEFSSRATSAGISRSRAVRPLCWPSSGPKSPDQMAGTGPLPPLVEQSCFDASAELPQGALQRAVRVARWCQYSPENLLVSGFQMDFSNLEAGTPAWRGCGS